MPVLPDVQVLTNNIIFYSWWIHCNTNTIETMYRIHNPKYLEYNASQLHNEISPGGQTVKYLIEIKYQLNIHNINTKFGPVYFYFASNDGCRP